MSKIKDTAIIPYELWLEEDQIVLIDTSRGDKPLGYYGSMECAVKQISKLSIVSKNTDYTLAGFIQSYNNITEKLTKNIKNI